MKKNNLLARLGLLFSCAIIIIGLGMEACAPPPADNTVDFTIGGLVTGLNGELVLENNDEDIIEIQSDGDFQFGDTVREGDPYNVTVSLQPIGQNCVVNDGRGIAEQDVTDVTVICTDTDVGQFTVGGMVEGLFGGESVVLQNNGGDNLTVTSEGSDGPTVFTFPTALENGATYSVTILTQPSLGSCQVLLGTGTIDAADVTSVEISCIP